PTRPLKVVPPLISLIAMTRRGSESVRPEVSSKKSRSIMMIVSLETLNRDYLFVGLDEVAEGFREIGIFRRGERIDAELILEPRHQDCEAQRVESGIEQDKVVGQRRHANLLLGGDFLDQADNC